MNEQLRKHYLTTSTYTYAGMYADYFRSLPDDIAELGRLVCAQVIHRVTLAQGNTGANCGLIYGDMTRYPWYRMRCEDDVLLTASAMTAELFRMDERGFAPDRQTEHKIVVCCRYVSVLMSAILKAKGVPCRCRAGWAPYIIPGVSGDHWINQYWDDEKGRWVTFDADGFFDEETLGFCQYDIPEDRFEWAADAWLDIREGRGDGSHLLYADGLGTNGLPAAIRYLLYDFHALMNNELTFSFIPCFIDGKLDSLTEDDLRELDELARLMRSPDENHERLTHIWNTVRKYRIVNSPLVGDGSNLPML